MKAFFAMCWNTADQRSAEQAEQIKEWINLSIRRPDTQRAGPGLLFLNLSDAPASDDVIELRDEKGALSGIVFGRLFERGDDTVTSAPVSGLRADKALRVIRSSGEALFNHYWGSYAALGIHDGKPWAVADPLSSVPCFFRMERGVLLVFSHLERCSFLSNVRYTLNRDFISLILHYDKLQTGETCFHEIRELMGGERLITSGSVARTDLLWDPRQIAAQTCRLALPETAELLRETTRASVASWAALFDRVRLNLSGGLDSSIVAACLAACCPSDKIDLVHQVMESTDQSELPFARATADHLGLNLNVELQSAQAGLPGLDTHPASARPYRQFLAAANAQGGGPPEMPPVFTGQGGDHLFFVARLATVFADYLKLNGLSAEIPERLFEAARLSGKSIWQVIREAALSLATPVPASPLARAVLERRTALNLTLPVSAETLSKLPVWTRQPAGLPPAKFQQVNLLAHLVHMRRPVPGRHAGEVIHPLMSQPLVELCLRIPTFQLATGGVSRGLARLAFEDRIPNIVRERITKGSAGRYYRSRTLLHRDEIASALLEGELVARSVLHRNAVAEFFARREDERHNYGHMALIYYTVEAWLRRWRHAG